MKAAADAAGAWTRAFELTDSAEWTEVALTQTASWFFVDFMGMDGWISAQYAQTEGACG